VATTRTQLETSRGELGDMDRPTPGLVVLFRSGRPVCVPIAVRRGSAPLVLGRDDLAGAPSGDPKMSRRHARVSTDGPAGLMIEDLGSSNGTYINGDRITEPAPAADGAIIRVGSTLLMARADIRPYLARPLATRGGLVIGPALARAHDELARAALVADLILIRGESGSGKEHAARHVHQSGAHCQGPFVALNCAAIPEGVAERVLFGATRGAYSGANADAEGVVNAADGGVLFLDEIGELSVDVQAKLLRFVETREAMAVGATRPVQLRVKTVCATHRDLRQAVADGGFRADLYYRLAQVTIELPTLRQRPEEIPFLVARELAVTSPSATIHAALIEECLLRPWPGNVRELLAAVRRAVISAGPECSPRREHLPADAGHPLASTSDAALSSSAEAPPGLSPAEASERARVLDALNECAGNQTAAARRLGISRKTLIERMKAFQIPRPRVAARGPWPRPE
jgi:transcriptional regulator of acetoin/glycerol metabolism